MSHHRRSLLSASIALLPLTACLHPGIGPDDSATSTGTTTPLEDDTTWGHIQTVTGPDVPTTTVPTTGDTTGNDTDQVPPPLEESCHSCGNPESVQVCFCIDNTAAPPETAEVLYGCPGDAGFDAAAEQSCQTRLNKPVLGPNDIHCMEQLMCPMQGSGDPLVDVCDVCGDPAVNHFYCVSDTNVLAFNQYACEDSFGSESTFKAQCATALGKPESELTASNFFHTLAACPTAGTTGDGTTGDGTTGDGTTGDGTTADDTTGASTTGGTTTGSEPDNTTGSDTSDGDTSGGVLPRTGCERWDPMPEIGYTGGVHYMNIALVKELLADPTPLVDCDDVIFVPLPVSGFEVRRASPGELLYELGLRDGDVPLSLNGYSLAHTSDVVTAVGQLWFMEGATAYELIVQRGTAATTLTYNLTN